MTCHDVVNLIQRGNYNVYRWMLLMWMMKMKENVPTQRVKEARTASTVPCLISTSASSRWSRTVLHWIPSATRSIAVQSAVAFSPCSPRSSRTSRRTSRLTTDVPCAGKYSPEAGCLKDTWELTQVGHFIFWCSLHMEKQLGTLQLNGLEQKEPIGQSQEKCQKSVTWVHIIFIFLLTPICTHVLQSVSDYPTNPNIFGKALILALKCYQNNNDSTSFRSKPFNYN